MTQTNDYSFNAADASFTANPDITVYDNGTLIYGTEPLTPVRPLGGAVAGLPGSGRPGSGLSTAPRSRS